MHNIAFLNPAVLPFLTAALLPFLIHLLTRRKLKRVEISTVVFLQQLHRKQMRRVKLRQWLLLILRTLAIIFIVLAFSHPVVQTTPGSTGSNAPATVAILLDNSYSMGFETPQGTLFNLAKQRALEVVDLLKPGDEVFLIPFANQPFRSKQWQMKQQKALLSDIRDSILNIPLSYRPTDVGNALIKTAELLRNSGNSSRFIFLLTDMEKNGWKNPSQKRLSAALKGVHLCILPVEASQQDNVSLNRVILPQQILSTEKPVEFEVQVTNYRRESVRELSLSLYLNSERVSQKILNIGANQTKEVFFRVTPQQAGVVSGYLQIEPDRLSADNRRYFSIRVPAKVSVLGVGNEEGDTYFLRQALNPSGSEKFARVTSTTANQLSLQQIETNDVIALLNVSRLSRWQLERLHTAVSEGKGLLICLGPQIDRDFYNQQLLPRFSQVRLSRPLTSVNQKDSYYSFGWVDFSHPILRGLVRGNRIESPRFYSIYQTIFRPQVRPLIRYNQGDIALCESRLGKGRVILFTSAVDLQWTDLPIKGIFVPLLCRIVQYLATTLPEGEHWVGEPLRILGGGWKAPVECQKPTGERVSLLPAFTPEGVEWCLKEVETPGIWRFFSQGREISRAAVNVDSRESVPRRISPRQLRTFLGNVPVKVISQNQNLKREIKQLRTGRELWRECLLLALSLIVAEMAVAFTTATSEVSPQTDEASLRTAK